MPIYRKGEGQFDDEFINHAWKADSLSHMSYNAKASGQPRNPIGKSSYEAGRNDSPALDVGGPVSGDDLARGARDKENADARANRNRKAPSSRARERMFAEDIVEHGKNKGKASEVRANLENLNKRKRS